MNSVGKKDKSNINTIHLWISLFPFSMCISNLDLKFLEVVSTFFGNVHIFPDFFVKLKNGFLNLEHREYDKDGNTWNFPVEAGGGGAIRGWWGPRSGAPWMLPQQCKVWPIGVACWRLTTSGPLSKSATRVSNCWASRESEVFLATTPAFSAPLPWLAG